MTSISKNVYIDKLDDIVNKYNNTPHSTIKMRSVEVKSRTYVEFNKDAKLKVDDLVIRLKKFLIKKVKKHCAVNICR